MRLQQLEVTDVPSNNFAEISGIRRAGDAREVLEEVFELLEDYAPIFYTEELHNRIVAALMRRQM